MAGQGWDCPVFWPRQQCIPVSPRSEGLPPSGWGPGVVGTLGLWSPWGPGPPGVADSTQCLGLLASL